MVLIPVEVETNFKGAATSNPQLVEKAQLTLRHDGINFTVEDVQRLETPR